MRLLTLLLAASIASPAVADETPIAPSPAAPQPPAAEVKILSEKDQVEDDGYVVRLSLPTEDDFTAWTHPGIRIALGYGFEKQWGLAPAASDLNAHALSIRASSRIDRSWSLAVELQYGFASTATMSGLRYATTVGALLHPWRNLALSIGTGLGGLMLLPTAGRPTPPTTAAVANITLPDDAKLGSCTGNGWVGLTRAEYLFVTGSLFATGPFLELDGQYTRCEQPLGRLDKETGVQISARQWWLHRGVAIGWWASWR